MSAPPWQFFANPDSLPDIDLRKLTDSARQSFELVERWKGTQTTAPNHAAVDSVVTRVVTETQQYYLAITGSVDAAELGYSFSTEAIAFCERLARATESPESLTEGIREMSDLANKAYAASAAMTAKFREVRANMFEVLKVIPTQMDNVKNSQPKRISARVGFRIKSSPDPVVYSTPAQPPPAYEDVNRTASHSSQGILEDALLQLAKVSNDLGVLLTHIGSFVDWWGDMKQSLHHLESVIPSIKPDGSNPFRTESVTDQWQNVRNDYGLYRKQITEVQDFYRHLAPTPVPEDMIVGDESITVERLAIEAEKTSQESILQAKRLADEKVLAEKKQADEIQRIEVETMLSEKRKAEAQIIEQERLAKERRAAQIDVERAKAEAERRAEEKRAAALEAKRRADEEERRATEERRLAAEKKAEDIAKAKEAKRRALEKIRLAKQRRKAEEAQQRALDEEQRRSIETREELEEAAAKQKAAEDAEKQRRAEEKRLEEEQQVAEATRRVEIAREEWLAPAEEWPDVELGQRKHDKPRSCPSLPENCAIM